MTVYDEVLETFRGIKTGETFAFGEIAEMVHRKSGRNRSSIIPSDYCYNRLNNGISFEKSRHLFEYTAERKYEYLGENFPYTGKIYHRPKGESEVCVGEMVNGKTLPYDTPEQKEEKSDDVKKADTHITKRDISLNIRYKVLKRDNFRCCACGASPAKDPSVELHIDHIIPWSKGGETVIENLRTLCSKCNLGKSNLT